MNNQDHYRFIRSLRLPYFEGIPLEQKLTFNSIIDQIKIIDFNYDSISFQCDRKLEIGDEVRIELSLKKLFKTTASEMKVTILRLTALEGKFVYGASINNRDNQNYIELIHEYINSLKPNHLKNLIFKNTFEVRDVPKEESFHQFQILLNSVMALPSISIDEYIEIIHKFAPFAKIEKVDFETITKNKNLLEVYLVSRFKVNRFNDVTKWMIGFNDWKGLLSISIENRYLTYHQKCSNFFKLCYFKVKNHKPSDNHKEAIAFSSNILFVQSNENKNAWLFFKKIYEQSSLLKYHKFIIDVEIENGFFEFIDIGNSKDVLLLQIQELPTEQDLLLMSQKLKYFKGYKIILLGSQDKMETFRHYFEQSLLIGHIQSHWRFVFANNEIFSRFFEKSKSVNANPSELDLNLHPNEYYELLESIFEKKIA